MVRSNRIAVLILSFVILGAVSSGCVQKPSEAPAPAPEPVVSEGKILVSNTKDKTIAVIDVATDTIEKTVNVSTSGSWPSNQRIGELVAFNTKKGIDLIDVETLEVVKSIDLGSKANWQDFTPDGKLLVASARDVNQQVIIDADHDSPTFGEVLATIERDGEPGPCDMTISSDGKYAYIPDIYSDTFTVLDIANKKVLATIDILPVNTSVKVQPFMTTVTWDDKYVFIENLEVGGTESVIDVSDPANPKEIVRFVQDSLLDTAKAALPGITVKGGLGDGPQSDEITLDNKYALIINRGDATISVVDLVNLEIVKSIQLTEGGKPRTGDFSVDGSKFYVSGSSKNVVDVIDVATLEKIKTIEGFNAPKGVIGVGKVEH